MSSACDAFSAYNAFTRYRAFSDTAHAQLAHTTHIAHSAHTHSVHTQRYAHSACDVFSAYNAFDANHIQRATVGRAPPTSSSPPGHYPANNMPSRPVHPAYLPTTKQAPRRLPPRSCCCFPHAVSPLMLHHVVALHHAVVLHHDVVLSHAVALSRSPMPPQAVVLPHVPIPWRSLPGPRTLLRCCALPHAVARSPSARRGYGIESSCIRLLWLGQRPFVLEVLDGGLDRVLRKHAKGGGRGNE